MKEHLDCMHEALGSSSSTAKEKKEKENKNIFFLSLAISHPPSDNHRPVITVILKCVLHVRHDHMGSLIFTTTQQSKHSNPMVPRKNFSLGGEKIGHLGGG